MYRLRANEQKYKQQPPPTQCAFCHLPPKQIVSEGKYYKVVKNIYGYDLWDRRQVTDHLMIIPHQHFEDLSHLPTKSAIEYFQLINKYLTLGYDCFSRGDGSQTKSQPHFHTHLIKTKAKLVEMIQFSANPYDLVFK